MTEQQAPALSPSPSASAPASAPAPASADPRLVVSVPSQALRDAVGTVPDGVELLVWDLASAAPRDAIDLVVPPYMSSDNPLGRLDGVRTRLVQSQSIGYDGVEPLLPRGTVFANAASVHEASTAELAVGLILASQRGIPDFVRAAETGTWAFAPRQSLADRRVLLIGYGGVGAAIDDRLLPFEVEVTRVASRARSDDRGPIHGIDELPDLLPDAEIVIVVVPLTEHTSGLVDDAFLDALPDGALLVNVARGPVADTDALVRHATSGRIRLALDVTDPEPLGSDHALWSLPNVLISPHIGGATSAMLPRMGRLVSRQIAALLAGEEPENIVLRT
ncbi:2-hydroxyacid dehydrogenase [Plantibacter sp. YIM 135347]|uniref:2-hydroxyacid dehydrogenase n=1 Tax=Plantibacter sp. YIM 135347 TaxID=3423919 RepID=UPI003D354B78